MKITTYNGLFKLTKLCTQGGVRLFSEFDTLMLGQNVPNPSYSYTTIKYGLMEDGVSKMEDGECGTAVPGCESLAH